VKKAKTPDKIDWSSITLRGQSPCTW